MTTALTDSPIVLDRRSEGDGALFTVLGLFAVPEPATGERRCVTPSSALPIQALHGALSRELREGLDAGRLGFVVGFVRRAKDEEQRDVARRARELLRRQVRAFAEIYNLNVTEPSCPADKPRGRRATEGSVDVGASAASKSQGSEPLRSCECGCGTRITGRRDARYGRASPGWPGSSFGCGWRNFRAWGDRRTECGR